jgi:hypothetical protein
MLSKSSLKNINFSFFWAFKIWLSIIPKQFFVVTWLIKAGSEDPNPCKDLTDMEHLLYNTEYVFQMFSAYSSNSLNTVGMREDLKG